MCELALETKQSTNTLNMDNNNVELSSELSNKKQENLVTESVQGGGNEHFEIRLESNTYAIPSEGPPNESGRYSFKFS